LSQKLRLFYFVSLLKTQALCPEGSTWDEVRGLSAEFERFEKKHNDFAVRTTNEIDELFAKVDARVQAGTERSRSALLKRPFASIGSVTLPRNHDNDVTLQDKRV
jgi:hypothetical protein